MKRYTLIICLLAVLLLMSVQTLYAEPFLGEIRMFAGNFAPRGWAFCQGQLLSISGNEALYSLLLTTYGGDGRTTFALPDLRGRVVLGPGSGPGLTSRILGQKGGAERVTLTTGTMPAHTHTINVNVTQKAKTGSVTHETAAGNTLATAEIYTSEAPDVDMKSGSVAATATAASIGSGQPHENMPPFTTINFIICIEGSFPTSN